MMRVGDLFDVLGGNASVARDLLLKPSAVSEMKRRNSIPPKYWARLIGLADLRGIEGVTADALVRLHAAEDDASASYCPAKSDPVLSQGAGR